MREVATGEEKALRSVTATRKKDRWERGAKSLLKECQRGTSPGKGKRSPGEGYWRVGRRGESTGKESDITQEEKKKSPKGENKKLINTNITRRIKKEKERGEPTSTHTNKGTSHIKERQRRENNQHREIKGRYYETIFHEEPGTREGKGTRLPCAP